MNVLEDLARIQGTLHEGLDRTSELYIHHLEQQRQDGPGQEATLNYLNHLFDKILPLVDPAKDWTAAAKSWQILDVGARMFLTYDFFKELGNTTTEGIDVGLWGLEHCRQNNKPCFELDAHCLPDRYAPNSQDLVYSSHCLEHCIGMPIVMRHIYQILKPGGLFYLALPSPMAIGSNPNGHWYSIDSDEHVLALLQQSGFSKEGILFSQHYTAVLRDADEVVVLARK